MASSLAATQSKETASTMELPATLVAAIESTHVAFQGLSHPLRIVSVEADSPLPPGAEAVTITVETRHEAHASRAQRRFTPAELADERHVVEMLGAAMRAVLTGD